MTWRRRILGVALGGSRLPGWIRALSEEGRNYVMRLSPRPMRADSEAYDTFIAALVAGGVFANIDAGYILCPRIQDHALVNIKDDTLAAVLNGSPIWTVYRGYNEAATTDALAIAGLSGGTWYERRSDDLYPLGDSEDRLGVAVYGTLDAGQEAAFEAAADALLEELGAKNSGRTNDLACIFGASLEEGNFTQIVNNMRMVSKDTGPQVWLQAMTGAPFRLPVEYNFASLLGRRGAIMAMGGANLQQFVLWKPAAIASKARYAFTSPSRNGLNAGISGAEVFAGYEEHINDLRRAGIEIIHIGISTIGSAAGGFWGVGGSARTQFVVLNGSISGRAAASGEKYLDVQPVMEDPSSLLDPKDPDPTLVGPDSQHLVAKGAYAHGADAGLQAVIAEVWGIWPALDFTGNKFAQQLTAYSSGGTLSGGATGVVPTGMGLFRAAGSNLSVSAGFVKPDGLGGWTTTTNPADTDAWYEITYTSVGTPGAPFERVELRQDWSASGSGLPVNTYMSFSCDIDVGAESDLLLGIETYSISVAAPTMGYFMNMNGTSTTASTKTVQPKNWRRRESGIIRLTTTTTVTRHQSFMTLNPVIAGTGKVRFRNWRLIQAPSILDEFPVYPASP